MDYPTTRLTNHQTNELTRIRVLHRRDGANYPLSLGEGWGEVGKSKDQRKPFGCAITRSLSLRIETLRKRRASNRADKHVKSGIQNSARDHMTPGT